MKTLKSALKNKKISHAYLFTGPHGVGKTSVARILAHEVNELPYSDDSVDLDIIEIDAASNRRIDEIRDLREKVHIAPTAAKYKVYIIDEVHMLTKEAFNALLKTLEEPPAHCIFILATTEAHKLPDTIVSRTQKYTFKAISKKQTADHLEKISAAENIKISREALELLAEHGEGSFRDSISLLDQLSSAEKEIDASIVSEILGLPPENLVTDILEAVENDENTKLVKLLDSLRDQAVDPIAVVSSLSQKIRDSLVSESASDINITLLKNLLEISSSANPRASLEICLLEACLRSTKPSAASKTVPVATKVEATTEQVVNEVVTPDKPTKKPTGDFKLEDWPSVVDKVKTEAASLYTALRLAVPSLAENTLTLAFQFPLHQKKVAEAKAKDIIGRLVEEVSGTKLAVECVVDKSIAPKPVAVSPTSAVQELEPNEQTQTISNIFGGAELLES